MYIYRFAMINIESVFLCKKHVENKWETSGKQVENLGSLVGVKCLCMQKQFFCVESGYEYWLAVWQTWVINIDAIRRETLREYDVLLKREVLEGAGLLVNILV